MSDTPTYPQNTVVTDVSDVDTVLAITVKATKGNFKVIVEGDETGNVKYNATAEELQTALNKLGAIDTGDVVVTGGPGDATGTKPYVLSFGGQYTGANSPTVTTDVSGLEEGTKTAAVTTTTAGASVNPDAVQRGTGLADRTEETSPLTGKSPVTYRSEHASDYGD